MSEILRCFCLLLVLRPPPFFRLATLDATTFRFFLGGCFGGGGVAVGLLG